MAPIRILIVDDHTMVRDGLNTMLSRQRDFVVVGEATNGREATELAQDMDPDVILMDLRMPEVSGVEAMRIIGSRDPHVRFIVLTTFDTDEYIFDAIEAGATGYLLKDTSREELFNAVRAVHRGESQIEPGVAAKVLSRFQELSRQGPEHNREGLSEREIEVLQLIAARLGQQADCGRASYQRKHRQDPRRQYLPQAQREPQDRSGHPSPPARHHQALKPLRTPEKSQPCDIMSSGSTPANSSDWTSTVST